MPKNKMDEHVLVFSVNLLSKIGMFQGLIFEPNKYLDTILRKENHEFMKRRDAENNQHFKQLIPYVIFCHGDKILSYQRGVLLSEDRLLHNHSIGVGGHISIDDPNLFSTSYEEGMYREIHEELHIDTEYSENIVALLNDDSDDVGRVHFGIIHVLKVEKPLVRKKEKSINNPTFEPIQMLKKNIEKYENWSKICIDNIDKLAGLKGAK
ncbi:MAG: phosphoesterase [Pseudomonadota bacterium]